MVIADDVRSYFFGADPRASQADDQTKTIAATLASLVLIQFQRS
jgi:hypothetical protein